MRDYSERKKKWMEPIPGVFDIFLILPLWVMALLEACDVTNNGRHLGF